MIIWDISRSEYERITEEAKTMTLEAKITLFRETIYPALFAAKLLDEKDAVAVPVVLSFEDSLAENTWATLFSAFNRYSTKDSVTG